MIALISGGLFMAWALCAACGVLLWRRGARFGGAALSAFGLIFAGAQIALSVVPVGIGEPLIRIETITLAIATLGGVALGLGAAFVLARRGWVTPPQPRSVRGVALAIAAPVASGLALWGLAYTSTPLRERERNANRRPITVPAGFKAELYADAATAGGELDNPTVIAFGPDGALYLADIAGNLWFGRDADKDNKLDSLRKIGEGYQLLVGLAVRGDTLYASSAGKVEALRDSTGDGIPDERRTLADGLPSMILMPHSNNSLSFGPDGRLYFGVGGTVQRGPEPTAYGGSILSVSPDGGDVRVFARGFDNSFDVAFNSKGQLFGGDNTTTPAGESAAPDEFNHITEGGDYSIGAALSDPLNIDSGKRAPIATFAPHSTPTGMTIYTGRMFPPQFFDSGFVTLWNKGEVMHVELVENRAGYQAAPAVFASGFLYPIDVVVGPDDALYIADFGTSAVYRVTYEGAR
jgi:glucose/arabinose dehydrogenase